MGKISSKYYIISSKEKEYAQKYFGDTNIEKIEILKDEGNGNLHWPSRILLGEYMTKYDYPEELAISGFTLAFFEDLGHFKIKRKFITDSMKY